MIQTDVASLQAAKGLEIALLNQRGYVSYYLLEDDARTNLFTELLVYDSWVQYDSARQSTTTVEMERVFKELDECVEEGLDRADVDFLKVLVGKWPMPSIELPNI